MVNFPRASIDRGVHFVPPSDLSDPRTLTAEELALNSEINALSLKPEGRLLFLNPPRIYIEDRILNVEGTLESAIYTQQLLSVNYGIEIANSWETGETSKQEYVYLLTMLAYVGKEQDSALGNFSRQFNDQTINGPENTKRLRCFWLTVTSYVPLSVSDIQNAIAISPQPVDSHSPVGELTIDTEQGVTNKTGFLLGNLRFYASDSNLTDNSYTILLDSLEVNPLGIINHYQNHVTNGYEWAGASPHMPPEELAITARQSNQATPDDLLNLLLQGEPLGGKRRGRAVLNAILGSTTTGSTPHPGITSNSPNGSNIQANDQRVFYSNEGRLQRNSIQYLLAEPDGNSRPMVTATLNTENPAGSIFSTNQDDHRVYSLDGVLQNDFGSFTDLGSDRSLSWFGNQNSSVQLGDTLIVAPGIQFSAGSGFSLPFARINAVYYNGVPLDSANVRKGKGEDLDAYTAPSNGEDFIVVWGSERAALHYIYKKITITTDSNGVALVPNTELGCFAFVAGVSGRIDEPVYLGLTPNTNYDCLVYYPPRSNGEIWQFEVEYTPYQGLGVDGLDLLDGGTIISPAINLVHSQGGGLSVHRGDSSKSESAIAFHLPQTPDQYPSYNLNSPVRLQGEAYGGPITLRELFMLHGLELTLPVVGQKLTTNILGAHYPRSLNISLTTDNDQLLGYRLPQFHTATSYYQSICAFLVQKGEARGLVVVTHNQVGGTDLSFDASSGAAIDVFPAYRHIINLETEGNFL